MEKIEIILISLKGFETDTSRVTGLAGGHWRVSSLGRPAGQEPPSTLRTARAVGAPLDDRIALATCVFYHRFIGLL